jgi:hypothetical protein
VDPCARKNCRELELSNSRPLSHWTAFTRALNWVEAKATKAVRVLNVSDLRRKGKVHK